MCHARGPLLTGLALVVVALSAVRANDILFHDDFEGQPSFPNSHWQIGHFLNNRTNGVVVPDPDNPTNMVLSFNNTVPFTGGGDLFTQGLFTTPTGRFKVSLDFKGTPGCITYIGWYFPPLPPSSDPQLLVGRHGWMGASRTEYCARLPLDTLEPRLQTCDQSMTGLPNGDWTHYEIEPALACLINFPRNETAIAQGFGVMVEDTGSTPFSCFYDNITLTAIVPTSSAATVGTDSIKVNFTLDSPSFVMKPALETITTSVTADFVRAVELSPNNSTNSSVVVSRDFPTTGYAVASSGPEVTFTNTLPLYGAKNATFEVVYTLFSGGEQVDTGAAVFTAAKDSLEWAIQIRDWPFAAPDNSLLVEFGLGHFSSRGADVSVGTYRLESATHRADEKLDEYVLRLLDARGQPGAGLKLIVPLVAFIDGAAQPTDIERPVLTTAAAFAQFLGSSADGGVSDLVGLAAAVGGLVDRLVFRFPLFNATLDYDPNLGLLLNGKAESDDGGSDNTVLIVLTTVLISCAALAVLAALVAVYVIYRRRASGGPVNEELVVQLDAADEFDGRVL